MESNFLNNEQEEYQGGGLGSLIGSLYGWSALSMFADFHKTGVYRLPWTGRLKEGGVTLSAIDKPWGVKQVGKNLRGSKEFVGMGRAGSAQLFASKVTGSVMFMYAWTDPVFFGFQYLTRPYMWPIGAAWFGTLGLVHNTARAMERTRYTDMSRAFPETQASFTSRQRAVRAISESHLQARSAIGNEAQLFHR